MERMKIVIEPSSASVVAAVIKDSRFKEKNVCCIISGGNFDMRQLFDMLHKKAKIWVIYCKNSYIYINVLNNNKKLMTLDFNNFKSLSWGYSLIKQLEIKSKNSTIQKLKD